MGWADDSVEVIRLRGDDVDQVRRAIFPARRLIILSRDSDSPAEIAAVLTDSGFGESRVTVLGDLESDVESRVDSLARDRRAAAPALNVVCVDLRRSRVRLAGPRAAGSGLRPRRSAHEAGRPCLGPGPSDAPARSVALGHRRRRRLDRHRMAALPSELPCGRGRTADRTREADPGQRPGTRRARLVRGRTRWRRTILDELPQPDAVFIGGGATSEMLSRCWEALADGGPDGRSLGHPGDRDDHGALPA